MIVFIKYLFLNDFVKRGGVSVFLSTLLSKIFALIGSILIVRILDQNIVGVVNFVRSHILVFMPLVGLGVGQALLRYGSYKDNWYYKKYIYLFTIKKGFKHSVLITIIFGILSIIFSLELKKSTIYFIVYAFYIITYFFFEVYSSYTRVSNNNQRYAKLLITFSIITLTLSLIFGYFWNGIGYIIGITISPLITVLLFDNSIIRRIANNTKENSTTFELEKFGRHLSFGSVANQLTLVVDTIIVGYLVNNTTLIAIYTIGTLIPSNLLFIPSTYFLADFVHISENSNKIGFTISYIKRYLKIFIPITLLLALTIFLYSNDIIQSLFGSSYDKSVDILNIYMIGMIGSFLLRIPAGNILSASGFAKFNANMSYIFLFINILSCIFFTYIYGIKGAAISSSVIVWISGTISSLYLIKKIK